jgi:hypothetical protein
MLLRIVILLFIFGGTWLILTKYLIPLVQPKRRNNMAPDVYEQVVEQVVEVSQSMERVKSDIREEIESEIDRFDRLRKKL